MYLLMVLLLSKRTMITLTNNPTSKISVCLIPNLHKLLQSIKEFQAEFFPKKWLSTIENNATTLKKQVSFVLTRNRFVQIFQQFIAKNSPGYFPHLTCHADIPVLINFYFQCSSLHMHCKIAFYQTSFNKNT